MKNLPEKIYATPNFDRRWQTVAIDDESMEYVRKDAFIEKACDAYCKVCGHYPHTTPNHICRQDCDYYKNFRNYMKGE